MDGLVFYHSSGIVCPLMDSPTHSRVATSQGWSQYKVTETFFLSHETSMIDLSVTWIMTCECYGVHECNSGCIEHLTSAAMLSYQPGLNHAHIRIYCTDLCILIKIIEAINTVFTIHVPTGVLVAFIQSHQSCETYAEAEFSLCCWAWERQQDVFDTFRIYNFPLSRCASYIVSAMCSPFRPSYSKLCQVC